jgi:hypothetical protein
MKNKSLFYRDTSGELWFLGFYSNNFEDVEGDIITKDAHAEYSEWIKETGVKPPITLLHQPKFSPTVHVAQLIALKAGIMSAEEYSESYLKLYKPFAIAQAEKVIDFGGFVLVAGRILPGKENVAELLQKTNVDLGMSHGFIPVKVDGNIISKLRAFEFSVLPVSIAANKLTVVNIKDVNKMDNVLEKLTEEERQFMEEVLETNEEDAQISVEQARGLLSKLIGSKSTEEETVEVTEDYVELRDKIFVDLNVEGLQSVLATVNETFKSLNEKIEELEDRVKKTEVEDDVKIANQLNPSIDWGILASVADKTEETSEELLETLKEGALTSVDTKANGDDNILNFGFWGPMANK